MKKLQENIYIIKKKSSKKNSQPTIAFIHTIPATSLHLYFPLPERLRDEGFKVLFFFKKGEEADTIRKKAFIVKTLPLSRNPFSPGNIIAIPILAFYLRSNDVDIVETSTPVASVVGRIAATIAKVPIKINTVRGTFPRETHRIKYILFNLAEKVLHRTTTFTITINEKDKQEFIDKGFATIKDIINIGCGGVGVDFSRFNIENCTREVENYRKILGILENEYVVTFIGRLSKEKGVDDFLKVVSMLIDDGICLKALIIGDVLKNEHARITFKEIQSFLSNKKIEDKVIFLGFRNDIPNLLALTDVLILPSRREGFGMVIAEAAAMRKPAVAYRSRGTEEAILNGRTGILVENGDVVSLKEAVKILLRDADKRKLMGEAAFTRARERFDKEIIIKRYIKLFNIMLSKRYA